MKKIITVIALLLYLKVMYSNNYQRVDYGYPVNYGSISTKGALFTFRGYYRALVFDSTLKKYTEIKTPLNKETQCCLFFNSDTFFMVTSDYILYKTEDGGQCYDSIYLFPTRIIQMEYVNGCICANSTNPTTGSGNLFRSTDFGNSFLAVNTSVPPGIAKYISKDTVFLAANTGYVNGTLTKTYNGGASWQTIFNSASDNISYFDFLNPDTGILYTTYVGLKKTVNGGASWTTLPSPPALTKNIKFLSKDTLLLLADCIVYLSYDGGTSWNKIDTVSSSDHGSGGNVNNNGIGFDELGKRGFFATGYYNSGTSGSNWSGKILFTEDGGKNWWDANQRVFAENDVWGMRLGLISDTAIFAVAGISTLYMDKMVISHDNAKLWNYTNTKPFLLTNEAATFINDSVGFLCGKSLANKSSLLKTTDAGKTWQVINANINGTSNNVYSVQFFDANNGIVYYDANCWKTINGGVTFTQIGGGIGSIYFPSFGTKDTGYATFSGNLQKTVNGGANWSVVNAIANGATKYMAAIDGQRVFVAKDSLLYFSSDGGQNFTLIRRFANRGVIIPNNNRKKKEIYYFASNSFNYFIKIDFNNFSYDSVRFAYNSYPSFFFKDSLTYIYSLGVFTDIDKLYGSDACNLNVQLNASSYTTPCHLSQADTFTLSGNINPSFSIRWFKNNLLLPNENSVTLIIDSLNLVGDVIRVDIVNNCGCTASKEIQLSARTPAQINAGNDVTICGGEPVILNATGGVSYSWFGGYANGDTIYPISSSSYIVTGINSDGCSSKDTMVVTVKATPSGAITPNNPTFCTGGNVILTAPVGNLLYHWSNNASTQNITVTQAGNYAVTVANTNNCSISTSTVVVVNTNPIVTIVSSGGTTFCNGSSVLLSAPSGLTYHWSNNATTQSIAATQTGNYAVTVTNGNSCTASTSSMVTVNPTSSSTLSHSVCSGSSYSFNNQNLTVAGTYYDTLSNSNGCDSIITLHLSVSPVITNSFTAAICTGNSYFYNGQNLTVAGTYLDTLTAQGGCDSIVTLNLAVNSTNGSSINASFCNGSSYSFNGQLLTVAGNYYDTLSNGNGCDSLITLSLSINPLITSSFNAAICTGNSYFYNGQNLTVAGAYLDTLTAQGGCDSIVTLNLAVNSTNGSSLNASVCNGSSYPFNGQSLTVAGVYYDTLSNSNGCDSIVTLNLSVNSLVTSSFNAAICTGNSYYYNGQNLTVAGAYLDTLTAQGGCDSIVTLNLTINQLPVVTLSGNPDTLCINAGALTLTGGNPAGGVYSGSGVGSGSFTPAATGSTDIIYTYTDGNSCFSYANETIVVDSCINHNCHAFYTLYPDTTTPHNWWSVNQATGTGAISYTWYWGDGSNSTGATPSHTYSAAGNYNICLTITDGAGCTDTYCDSSTYIYKAESMVTVNVVWQLPTGINEAQANALISIYPNPATSQLFIQTNGMAVNEVNIYNTTGSLVNQTQQPQTKSIDISQLANGVYIAEIKTKEASVKKRWVKM